MLTATMIAGFVAILLGKERYICTFVGLEPKFVTWVRAALVVARKADVVVRSFMVLVMLNYGTSDKVCGIHSVLAGFLPSLMNLCCVVSLQPTETPESRSRYPKPIKT